MQNTDIANDNLIKLTAQPGIEIAKRSHGDLLYVETDFNVFEIEVLDPSRSVVRIAATDKLFDKPKVGVFSQSVFDDFTPHYFPGVIKQSMRMQIRFLDQMFQSSRVISAAVHGTRRDGTKFYFDVF